MNKKKQNSRFINVFHQFPQLEPETRPVGYAYLIARYDLAVPAPDFLSAIGTKHRNYEKGQWKIYTPRYAPEDTLKGQLTFSLKYEGIDLAILKALFNVIEPQDIVDIVRSEPTGAYSRRIWFLYEWLCETELELENVVEGNFISLMNIKLQYGTTAINSKRHRIRNNLPGTREFCPLIRRTKKLDQFLEMDLSKQAIKSIGKIHKDLLSRAAAFLLLKDSKASYTIEGESPPHSRIERWGKMIGQAGQRELTIEELEYLQSIVIVDHRFIMPGFRIEGGFIGEHERTTGSPIPDHISARADDLETLLNGLINTNNLLKSNNYNAVLAATAIAFGFVFIHPFVDGNGRIHRYLFHHVLAEKGFVPSGFVFPISAVILDRIDKYKEVLKYYSKSRLNLIEWRPTDKGNVEVLNNTIDLYRYFDATRQAEFLFDCVAETVHKTLPEEVAYLYKYDQMLTFMKQYIEMPDDLISLLIRFLNQNNGKLSKRAREKEFKKLTQSEVQTIENKYNELFNPDS